MLRADGVNVRQVQHGDKFQLGAGAFVAARMEASAGVLRILLMLAPYI